MASPFAITAATNTVLLDNNRQGLTSFTVSNTTNHVVRGRAHIVAQQATAGSWLTLVGQNEREFAGSGSQQYVVQITVPPGAAAGDYTFRIDMVDLANPDDNFSEGPTIKFVVPAPVPVKRPFPWWIIAVIIGVLILIGAGTYGIVQLTHKNSAITPTPTVTKLTPTSLPPTPTPTPVFRQGSWQGRILHNDGQPTTSALLQLGTVQKGTFTGGLFGPGVGEGPSSGNISGQEGSLGSFSPDTQSRLQQAINQYGNGSGYVEFTIVSYGNLPINFPLNSVFDAVVFPDGSLHGVWFKPGDTQPDGTFVLNRQ